MTRKKYLFFFVHPSKFHVFRNTINHLKEEGHQVDVAITSKDVLENLVKSEGWQYTNIFPSGRKFKNVSPYISAGVNFFRTIYRLFKLTRGKKYDLFITDDLLVYVGKLKRVPSIAFTDDDLAITKQFSLILQFADYILAPEITDLERYNGKKLPFNGYKELAYLHPNQFTPNLDKIEHIVDQDFFLLRLVSLTAYHDVGKSGISETQAKRLIELLENYGKVYISAERELSAEMSKYRLPIEPNRLKDVLSQAKLYIGDSQTMSSEAAILGVPSLRFSDFKGKINVMDEKDEMFKLSRSYRTDEFELLMKDLESFLSQENTFVSDIKTNQKKMLEEKVDLTGFLIWILSEFPDSVKEYKRSGWNQTKFIGVN